MNYDIEAYINGELSGDELEAFEQEMRRNPDLERQVRQFSRLTSDIEMQTLREQVAAALKDEPKPLKKTRLWRWLGAIVGLAFLSVAGYFLYFNHQDKTLPVVPPIENPQTNPPSETAPQAPDNQPTVSPEEPAKKQSATNKPAPIAENKQSGELLPPPHPAPNVRGENTEDKAWKALLDQIWYTDYPPVGVVFAEPFAKADQLLKAKDFNNAYVQLQRLERNQPANDTLRFLKGYCLLEMGEGAEALAYFEKLEERQPAWAMQLQWYRGLILLLMGEKERAVVAFKQIAVTPKHQYRKQSGKALELLE